MFGSAPIVAVQLGGEHDVVAAALDRLGDDLLRLAPRVDVGGVDEVDAGVERGVDHVDRLVVVGVAPRAEHHRPEAEGADLHARFVRTPDTSSSAPRRVRSTELRAIRSSGRHVTERETAGPAGGCRPGCPRRRAIERTGGYPILSLAGRAPDALGERVGHRVLAEQEVEDRRVLELDRLDGRRGLDPGRDPSPRRSRRCRWPRRRSRGRARAWRARERPSPAAKALSTDFFTVRSTPVIAFLPAPVEHAVPRRGVVLVLALRGHRERHDRGGQPRRACPSSPRRSRPGRCRPRGSRATAASATTARSPLSFCADVAAGTPIGRIRATAALRPLPTPLPDERDPTEHARHHRAGTPGGSTASTRDG